MQNYFPDVNRFKLAGPPTWWLRRLWEFDNSLVVVPSRQSCVYRLAQRRTPSLQASIVNDALFKESDTKMLASYNLIPVTTIIATANWDNPYIFVELKNRMPSRMGGWEKVEEDLLRREMEEDAKANAENDDLLTRLSTDGWNLYLKKIGLRTHMYSPKVKRTAPPSLPKAPSLIIK